MTIFIRPETVRFREVGTDAWMPAQIPGGVHTDLMALDRIPDPFVADNELRVQWVAERDWEYEVVLSASPELLAQDHVFLVCDGLDTLAEVTFNGETLGATDNMFRQYRWDVTELLTEGDNILHVVFRSTVAYVREKQAELPLLGVGQAIPGGSYVRKAPSQFGWDWGPQLPPIGFWKEVRLEGYSAFRVYDVSLEQRHEEEGVRLGVSTVVERWTEGDVKVVATLTAPDGQVQQVEEILPKDDFLAVMYLEIADPQLWWPNGSGDQPLYKVAVQFYHEDTLYEQRAYQIGLRTLELRRERDKFGESFTFVINGMPIFAKGANWIPADSFPTRITDEHLEHLIRSAAEANMNMLRVWGGGFYEEERFYDLCDQYGILVWQDFAFACSVYPDDEDFFENVRTEAQQNIRRLQHRASLALWCGNNEMEGGWAGWGWMQRQEQAQRFKAAYDEMFHHMLPVLCMGEDDGRPYWPSSPSSGVPFDDPGGTWAGDTHNWEVWHGGQPFAHYRNHPSRFVSEFGFQSLPALDTIRTYADAADWNMTSYIMEHHQRNASGNGKIINYMTGHFRLPKDFPSLVYLTQVLQAEAVRAGVEFWRRNKACTSGTLYWQLNDCWPVASWASLDYFGRWKALHYAARRFYAPVLLSAELEDTRVTLYLTNDLPEAWAGTVRWSLETLSGEVLATDMEPVTISALGARAVCTLEFADHVRSEAADSHLAQLVGARYRHDVVLVYELWREEARVSMGVLSFVPPKHLALTDPGLAVTVVEQEGGFALTLSAQNLARFVWLTLESDALNTDLVFSDNGFDLPAGRSVTVKVPSAEGWTAEALKSALRVRSLVDSY